MLSWKIVCKYYKTCVVQCHCKDTVTVLNITDGSGTEWLRFNSHGFFTFSQSVLYRSFGTESVLSNIWNYCWRLFGAPYTTLPSHSFFFIRKYQSYTTPHRRISWGVRGGSRPPWSLGKISFRANQEYFQGKMTLWIARNLFWKSKSQ